MKKIFYTAMVVFAASFFTVKASAQYGYQDNYRTVQYESFLYYPQSNSYYSFRTRQYIFPSREGWQIAYRLPHYIHIGRETGIRIEHNGFDVWNDNRQHQSVYGQNYRTQPNMAYNGDRRDDDNNRGNKDYGRRDDDNDRRNNGY